MSGRPSAASGGEPCWRRLGKLNRRIMTAQRTSARAATVRKDRGFKIVLMPSEADSIGRPLVIVEDDPANVHDWDEPKFQQACHSFKRPGSRHSGPIQLGSLSCVARQN